MLARHRASATYPRRRLGKLGAYSNLANRFPNNLAYLLALGDWDSWNPGELSARGDEGLAELRALEQHIEDFLVTKTKVELFQRALEHRILLAPCNTILDICENPHLEARDFWTQMYHPDLDASLTYTGPFIKFSETPIHTRHLPPRLGQHNYEVFVTELGLAEDRLTQLQAQGVI